MAGRVVRVITRQQFSFKSLGASSFQQVAIAQRVDVSQWREGTLLVRAHDGDISGSNQKIEVVVIADGYTSEDPGNDFIAASESGSVEVNTNTPFKAPGNLLLATLDDAPMGSMVAVLVRGTQGTTATRT